MATADDDDDSGEASVAKVAANDSSLSVAVAVVMLLLDIVLCKPLHCRGSHFCFFLCKIKYLCTISSIVIPRR